MVRAYCCNWLVIWYEYFKFSNDTTDSGSFLCMRPDLRAYMVSVQAYNEKPMLYHLPYLQLGSSYDVFAVCFCTRLFYTNTVFVFFCNMAGVGTMCDDVSRAVLGGYKCCTPLQRMY